jgi:D-lactate dehydrogenase (cytochrome)
MTLHSSAITELQKQFGDQLSTNPTVLNQHGHDESGWQSYPPEAVLFAHDSEQVSAALKICHAHDCPVIAFGTGTAIEGHVQALQGGLCIDLSAMNQVIRVNAEDMDCIVQTGVTRKQLAEHIRDSGLFFSVDPGADATLGGMAATGASGTNTVRYGSMRDNVRALTVVMANGDIIKTGTRARKSSAGYDLTHLFIGSEGTLGIITELTVKLHGLQEAISAAICHFPSIDAAVQTVIEAIQYGIPVARMELLDDLAMKAINTYCKLDYPERPHLFMEFHGSEMSAREQAEQLQEIARDNGGDAFNWASHAEDRNKLWQARHDAYPAALQLRPGCRPITTDVCVPISRLSECIGLAREMIEQSDIPGIILGHVGDGNFHVLILPDAGNAQEISEAEAINHRLVELALAMDGTCSGEHGIGMGKKDFLQQEHPTGIVVMRQIKQCLDPKGILNPGKIFPDSMA